MTIEVIPRYVFVVDWANTGIQLPHDHTNAITPTEFDIEGGLDLFDIHSMRGLRGSFSVNDPEGVYDPTRLEANDPLRAQLEAPHRFYQYRLDASPPDTASRQTGWVIVDRRPDRNTARFRLLPLDFQRLREDISLPQFNTYIIPEPPPKVDRDVFVGVRLPGQAQATGVVLAGLNADRTTATLQVFWEQSNENFDLANTIYLDVTGQETYSDSSPATGSPIAFNVPVVPGTTYLASADVRESLDAPVTLTFTVPVIDVVVGTVAVSLSVDATDTEAKLTAIVTNPPSSGQVTFDLGGDPVSASVDEDGVATYTFSNLTPSTLYTARVEVNQVGVTDAVEFTTEASGETGPVVVTPPNVQVSSFTANVTTTGAVFAGSVTDLNNTGGALNAVTVQLEYRKLGTTAWTNALRHTPNADGSFQVFQPLPLGERFGEYEARAYVVTAGLNEGYDRFDFGTRETTGDVVINTVNVVRSVSARATGTLTAVAVVTVSTGLAGTVYLRYRRRRSLGGWLPTLTIARAANTAIVTFLITEHLSPGEVYDVQAANNPSFTNSRAASFTTESAAVPFTIDFFAASRVTRSAATITVRSSGGQTASTPSHTITLSSSRFGIPTVTRTLLGFNVLTVFTGLQAGTLHTVTVVSTKSASLGESVSRNLTFTTQAAPVVVVQPTITNLSFSGITSSSVNANVSVNLGSFTAEDVRVVWSQQAVGGIRVNAGSSPIRLNRSTGPITSLSPGTTYSIRATLVVNNRAGATREDTFTTLVPTAPPLFSGLRTLSAIGDIDTGGVGPLDDALATRFTGTVSVSDAPIGSYITVTAIVYAAYATESPLVGSSLRVFRYSAPSTRYNLTIGATGGTKAITIAKRFGNDDRLFTVLPDTGDALRLDQFVPIDTSRVLWRITIMVYSPTGANTDIRTVDVRAGF